MAQSEDRQIKGNLANVGGKGRRGKEIQKVIKGGGALPVVPGWLGLPL